MNKLLLNAVVTLFDPGAASTTSTSNGGMWFALLVPLITITAGLLALLWWLRRGRTLGSGGNRGPMKIVQAVAVGARERVVVLDAQGRRLVLGVTAQRVELIAELHREDPET
ncbi:flagellar biosynthetic protein FliO [Rhodanobacter sp. Col0626]|uniref:flagellar biosynthetic protein FliO n=1 Tax=Rhodanobacter sp. Col0626 TaxID=3415679 RepID=UPI003CFA1F31